jgi:ketosteroid isomerase-like protein
MKTRILFTVMLSLFSLRAAAQMDTGPATDVRDIHILINRYAKAIDTVDLNLVSQIWSHSAEVSFIYPIGEEHGFEAIRQHVFQDVMGGMFSIRHLEVNSVTIHVSGNEAWSEFHWTFHATMRKDASAITTHGVETQVYQREAEDWHLVHVHYSEDHRILP